MSARLLVTLIAVARHAEGHAAGIMIGTTRGMTGFGRLVHPGLPVQRRFGLGPQLVMAELAIILRTYHVLGMIEGHVPILRLERQFRRSFGVLSQ